MTGDFFTRKKDGAETFPRVNVYNSHKIYSKKTFAGALVSGMK